MILVRCICGPLLVPEPLCSLSPLEHREEGCGLGGKQRHSANAGVSSDACTRASLDSWTCLGRAGQQAPKEPTILREYGASLLTIFSSRRNKIRLRTINSRLKWKRRKHARLSKWHSRSALCDVTARMTVHPPRSDSAYPVRSTVRPEGLGAACCRLCSLR